MTIKPRLKLKPLSQNGEQIEKCSTFLGQNVLDLFDTFRDLHSRWFLGSKSLQPFFDGVGNVVNDQRRGRLL